MRKVIQSLLLVQIAALLLCVVSAASVSGETLTARGGESIVIPVCISDNGGIMGFRIMVDYPTELLCQPEVCGGTLTGNGMFDSNTAQEGHIEVLWCASSDVQGDGSLFHLKFTVREAAPGGSAELRLSYSQEDTFNERWEDVVLQLSPIIVNIEESSSAVTSTQGTTSAPTSEEAQPSSEHVETTTEPIPEITESTVESSVEISTEKSTEPSPIVTEVPTASNTEEEENRPVLLIGLIAVVILGSIGGICWRRRRK